MPSDADRAWIVPASSLCRSLANEHRLLVLQQLRDGEKTTAEPAHLIGISQPRLLVQLQRLLRDHLVTTRREGRVLFYSLAREDVLVVLDAVRAVFEER